MCLRSHSLSVVKLGFFCKPLYLLWTWTNGVWSSWGYGWDGTDGVKLSMVTRALTQLLSLCLSFFLSLSPHSQPQRIPVTRIDWPWLVKEQMHALSIIPLSSLASMAVIQREMGIKCSMPLTCYHWEITLQQFIFHKPTQFGHFFQAQMTILGGCPERN